VLQLDGKPPFAVMNVQGRSFMNPLENPFTTAQAEVLRLRAHTRVILVDMHAEATSEKIALGRMLDGQVSAVIGTHTHVQTADERILSKGTACMTDVGMTGPHDSIIGVTVEAAISRFLNGMPAKFEAATGPGRLNAAIVTADPATGKATAIERLNLSADEVDAL
jgi:metallophosphoesterase (TIGR00282 family)